MVEKITFDGNDHPDFGKDAPQSGRRVNERDLEVTDKVDGKTTGTRQIGLSTDLKTLTMTDREASQSRPRSVLVFDREQARA